MNEHDNRDPPRWTDPGGDGPDGIADLFHAARTDIPADRLARVEAKLGFDGGGGGNIGAKTPGWVVPTAVGVGVLALMIGLATRPARESPPPSRTTPPITPALPVEPAPVPLRMDSTSVEATEPHDVEATSDPALETRRSHRPRATARERRAPSAPDQQPLVHSDQHQLQQDELEILMTIRAALRRGDARAALLQLASYDRAFPRGALREEARVLQIEALLRSGRRSEMERALARFRADHPGSAHLRRLEQLIEEFSREAP